MYFRKKSQFFILSGLFFLSLIIFIYSIETENNYIIESTNYNLLDNILYEACQIGIKSNATNIASRYSIFTAEVLSYCGDFGDVCNLSITLKSDMPPGGNMSLLNYTQYDYFVDYIVGDYNYVGNFSC